LGAETKKAQKYNGIWVMLGGRKRQKQAGEPEVGIPIILKIKDNPKERHTHPKSPSKSKKIAPR